MMSSITSKMGNIVDYLYETTEPNCANAYFWPAFRDVLTKHQLPKRSAFDLGCGNGATANMLSDLGYDVTGVDVSDSGIALGRKKFPHLKLCIGSAYDDLAQIHGQYPLVVSLEVIEH